MATKPAPKPEVKPQTAVARTTPTAVVPWNEVKETGFENVSASDLGIPFLTIVQKGSAEYDKTHVRYNEKKILGVEVGDVINIISREIAYHHGGDPLIVVPVHWDKFFMEWKPRTASGGGIVTAHKDEHILATCRRNEKNLDVLPNGNIIVTTAYFHIVTLNEELTAITGRLMIGMSSTQLRKSRSWLNTAQSLRVRLADGRMIMPPLFSHAYELGTQAESNDKGSWMGWSIKVRDMVTDATLAEELVEANRTARATGQDAAVRAEQNADTGDIGV